jgi:hypothetical protein
MRKARPTVTLDRSLLTPGNRGTPNSRDLIPLFRALGRRVEIVGA